MALWKGLIAEPEERVLPWLGAPRVHARERSWQVCAPVPPEHGWYRFRLEGRRATVVEPDTVPLDFELGQATHVGYLIGDRLVGDRTQVRADALYLDALVSTSRRVHLVERGLGRFTRATVIEDQDGVLVFVREQLPLGPERDVEHAYQDGLTSIDHLKDIPPALDLAFRWLVRERQRRDERRRQLAREAERRQALASGDRRVMAAHDLEAAVRAALALSGAQLLDLRAGHDADEIVVVYRFRGRRLECVAHRHTLRIIDAGVCLTDAHTHERGDTYFTLESLPAVIGQAIDEDQLVVFRHHDDD